MTVLFYMQVTRFSKAIRLNDQFGVMRYNRKNIVMHCKVFMLSMIYLFVALSHIYFLANVTSPGLNTCQISKLNNKASTDYIKRTDKAVFKKDKQSLLNISSTVDLHNSPSARFSNAIKVFCIQENGLLGHKRYDYLLFLALRI